MKIRVSFFLSFLVVLPLFGQQVEAVSTPNSSAASGVESSLPSGDGTLDTAATEERSRRELKLITNSGTANRLAKFDSSGQVVIDSLSVFEDASGKIGIGTLAPQNALHILAVDGASGLPFKVDTSGPDSISGIALRNDARTWHIKVDGTDGDKFKIYDVNAGSYRMTINSVGNVGIGTINPQSLLHLAGTGGANSVTLDTPGLQKFRLGTLATQPNWGAMMINASYNSNNAWALDDTASNGWFLKLETSGGNGPAPTNGLWLYRIPEATNPNATVSPMFGVTNGRAFFPGQVGIGVADPAVVPTATLQVTGTMRVTSNLTVDGNISGAKVLGAVYQDVAEWVPSSDDLAPGTVVILDQRAGNTVTASRKAYDTLVAGVVSTQPGILLGEGSPTKEQIATTGRVRVRVDATKGAIEIGDLLVTGNLPGTAMKSMPIDIAGFSIHRPGTIIGKALEPLDHGVGEILVLLSLQ